MTVGSLSINLGMVTSDVAKGANLAKGYLSGIGAVASKLNSSLGLLGVGLGIGGVAGILKTVSSTASEIREQSRGAERLGMTTGQLQGLQYAAKKSGMDVETFNTSLSMMARNLGEAAIKGGPVAESLARIGLDATELAQMKPADALFQIVDAFKDIENVAVRKSLIREIFGRGGDTMDSFLRKGSEGINKFIADAKRLGLISDVFDEKKISAYKAAMGGLESTFKGISMSVTTMMAPSITAVAIAITEMVNSARDFAPVIVKAVIALAAFKTAMWAVSLAQKVVAGTQALIVALSGPKGWAQVIAATAIAAGVYGLVSREIEKVSVKAEELVKANQDVAESAKAVNLQMIETADAAKRAQKIIDDAKTPWEKWAEGVRDISKALADEDVTAKQATAAFEKLGEELDKSLGGAKSKIKELKDEIFSLRYGIDALDVKKLQELGAKPEDIESVKKLQKEVARGKELASGQQHYDQRTPLEEFNYQTKILQELRGQKAYRNGELVYDNARISTQQFNAGMADVIKNLESTLPQISSKPTGAFTLGSRDEYSMRARINNQSPERTAKDILEQAKKQNERLLEIQKNTADQVVNLVTL